MAHRATSPERRNRGGHNQPASGFAHAAAASNSVIRSAASPPPTVTVTYTASPRTWTQSQRAARHELFVERRQMPRRDHITGIAVDDRQMSSTVRQLQRLTKHQLAFFRCGCLPDGGREPTCRLPNGSAVPTLSIRIVLTPSVLSWTHEHDAKKERATRNSGQTPLPSRRRRRQTGIGGVPEGGRPKPRLSPRVLRSQPLRPLHVGRAEGKDSTALQVPSLDPHFGDTSASVALACDEFPRVKLHHASASGQPAKRLRRRNGRPPIRAWPGSTGGWSLRSTRPMEQSGVSARLRSPAIGSRRRRSNFGLHLWC